jgi:uncharacterized protein YjbI with pentapeptide repeats
MERIELKQAEKQLDIRESRLDGSQFVMVMLSKGHFENVDMTGTKVMNANLSDLEIEGAQLGGAYIHNIGMPPKGHPLYDPAAKMRPVKFEDCYLADSTFHNCNLSGLTLTDCNLNGAALTDCNLSSVALKDCNVKGMTINGISVEELLERFREAAR